MMDRQQAADAERAEAPVADDPYLWLEEIDSPQVRAWVEARNAGTVSALWDAQFEKDRAAVLDILNAPERTSDKQRASCLQHRARLCLPAQDHRAGIGGVTDAR
jgi:prolyl oligopeptidase PreP (S9A serine peptidase family)